MSITTTCPNCKVLFRLADDMSGKKVKCQKCAHVFVVGMSQGTTDDAKADPDETAVTPPKAKPLPVTEPIEDDDDDDRKRSKKNRDDDDDDDDRKSSSKKRAYDDDDDDRGPPRRRSSYDDDDDDDDRGPSRKRKPKVAGSNKTMIVVLLLVLGVGILGCGGCGVGVGIWYFMKDGDNPKAADFPAGGINVLFNQDKTFKDKNVLRLDDPFNQIVNKRTKAYTVHLVQGDYYQIDMYSRQFDSYLFLIDLDGNRVVRQDDDGGGFPDARIVYRAPRTGFYRIHATHFGMGGQNFGFQGDFTLNVRRSRDGRVVNPPVP